MLFRMSVGFAALGALVATLVLILPLSAGAQAGTGTVTGRLLWGACIRIPLPATGMGAPDTAEVQPVEPQQPDMPQPNIIRPPQPPTPRRSLPAGAVLVAVQNTSINARSDEAGKFTLSGVPAGQYLTVAAGPVANASAAIATRPNVFLDAGQSVDLGNLVLGGGTSPNLLCRAVGAAEGEAVPAEGP